MAVDLTATRAPPPCVAAVAAIANPASPIGGGTTSVEPVSATITTADAAERERYEAHADATLAGILQYRRRPALIALVHTEVVPAFEGQGVGGALARAALDDARAGGIAVLPFCPFVNAYIQRHPEYADLVPANLREQFGL